MVIKAEICRGGLEGRIFLRSLRPKFVEGGLEGRIDLWSLTPKCEEGGEKAEWIYGH